MSGSNQKLKNISFRVSEAEIETLKQKAGEHNLGVSEYIRKMALEGTYPDTVSLDKRLAEIEKMLNIKN